MNKKILTSLGALTIVASPIATTISCSGWTGQKKEIGDSVNLSSADKTVWHQLFYSGGRSVPKSGLKLEVNVSGQKVSYEWTQADAQAVTPKAYLAKTASQQGMLSYIAHRFATAPGVEASDAFEAMSFAGHPNTGSVLAVDMSTEAETDTRKTATVSGTAKEVNGVAIDGVQGWHQLFMSGTPNAGTIIQLPLNASFVKGTDGKMIPARSTKPADANYKAIYNGERYWAKAETLLSFTWSAKDDVALPIVAWKNGIGSQGAVVQYVQNKFIALSPINYSQIVSYIRDNSGGHLIWEELGYVNGRPVDANNIPVVWTYDISSTPNISSAQLKAWHSAFANTNDYQNASRNGRSLPLAKDVFKFTVGSVSYTYTWTEQDNTILAGWLTNEWNQYQVVEYVAAKLSKGNSNILNAILLSMPKEHIADGGAGTRPAHWPSQSPTEAPIIISGSTQWHQLFKTGIPINGQKISLPINGAMLTTAEKEDGTTVTNTSGIPATTPIKAPEGKVLYTISNRGNLVWAAADKILETTWDANDSKSSTAINWLNNPTTQSDVVKYIMNKYISANPSDAAVIKSSIAVVSGGHWIHQDLEHTAKRTKVMTFDLKVGNKAIVNSNPDEETGSASVSNAWHIAFALDSGHLGRTLPLAGDTFKFADKTYTWTDADNLNLARWMTFGINQNQVAEYVANKIAGYNINYFYAVLELMTRHNHSADGSPTRPSHWVRPSYSSVTDLTDFITSQPAGFDTLTLGKAYKVTIGTGTSAKNYFIELTEEEINHPDKPTGTITNEQWAAFFAKIISGPNAVAATETALKTAMGIVASR